MEHVILDGQSLTLAQIEAVSLRGCPVSIAQAALTRVEAGSTGSKIQSVEPNGTKRPVS